MSLVTFQHASCVIQRDDGVLQTGTVRWSMTPIRPGGFDLKVYAARQRHHLKFDVIFYL